MLEYHRRRDLCLNEGVAAVPEPSEEQRRELERLSSLKSRSLTENETKRVLSLWGVPVTREHRAETVAAAVAAAKGLGYPVALKVDSPDILHKTESGLVKLGIGDEEALRFAYEDILSNARASHPDSRVGGVLVELYRDVSFRVCPITRHDAREMLQEVRGARILDGYRNSQPGDTDALLEVMLNVSSMAVHLGSSLKELDINPLAVLPQGRGVKALDALAVFGV